MALRRPRKGMKMRLTPGTGNHKGCPYEGFVVAYFHSNDGEVVGVRRLEDGDVEGRARGTARAVG